MGATEFRASQKHDSPVRQVFALWFVRMTIVPFNHFNFTMKEKKAMTRKFLFLATVVVAVFSLAFEARRTLCRPLLQDRSAEESSAANRGAATPAAVPPPVVHRRPARHRPLAAPRRLAVPPRPQPLVARLPRQVAARLPLPPAARLRLPRAALPHRLAVRLPQVAARPRRAAVPLHQPERLACICDTRVCDRVFAATTACIRSFLFVALKLPAWTCGTSEAPFPRRQSTPKSQPGELLHCTSIEMCCKI